MYCAYRAKLFMCVAILGEVTAVYILVTGYTGSIVQLTCTLSRSSCWGQYSRRMIPVDIKNIQYIEKHSYLEYCCVKGF